MRAKDTFAQVYATGSPFFDENQYKFMTLKTNKLSWGRAILAGLNYSRAYTQKRQILTRILKGPRTVSVSTPKNT